MAFNPAETGLPVLLLFVHVARYVASGGRFRKPHYSVDRNPVVTLKFPPTQHRYTSAPSLLISMQPMLDGSAVQRGGERLLLGHVYQPGQVFPMLVWVEICSCVITSWLVQTPGGSPRYW